jgi:tetratricopeptide (TPR) repeat protein
MDVEKKSFPDIAKQTVLDPLNMSNSTYEQPLPDNIRRTAASGHKPGGNLVSGKIHIYPEMAAAGLWTTPTDLARFAIEVQLSLAGRSNKVLKKETVAKMVTPVIDQAGLGFFSEKRGNAIYFGHGGADEGFRAQLLVHRDKGYGAVVMVNSDNGQIINEILRAIAKEYRWEDFLPQPIDVISVDAKRLETYSGRYQINPDRVLTVTTEGGRLYVTPTAEGRIELFAVGEESFIRNDAELRYTFVKEDSGRVERLSIKAPQQAVDAVRVPANRLVPFELLAAGRIGEAVEAYRRIKRDTPESASVREGRLNNIGYMLIADKKYPEAIAILKLNVELYPQSSNAYDSLGEVYMLSGQKQLARENYRKSLELDPNNRNAVEMLKKLEE